MKTFFLSIIVWSLSATAHAVPIHPNMVSVAFDAPTFSTPLPDNVHFTLLNGTFFVNPSGFFGGLAGFAAIAGDLGHFDVRIQVVATTTLWNNEDPNLSAVFRSTFIGRFYDSGSSAYLYLPSGGFFSAASFPYWLGPNEWRQLAWDGDAPTFVDATPEVRSLMQLMPDYVEPVQSVPEPSTLMIVGAGLVAIRQTKVRQTKVRRTKVRRTKGRRWS